MRGLIRLFYSCTYYLISTEAEQRPKAEVPGFQPFPSVSSLQSYQTRFQPDIATTKLGRQIGLTIKLHQNGAVRGETAHVVILTQIEAAVNSSGVTISISRKSVTTQLLY